MTSRESGETFAGLRPARPTSAKPQAAMAIRIWQPDVGQPTDQRGASTMTGIRRLVARRACFARAGYTVESSSQSRLPLFVLSLVGRHLQAITAEHDQTVRIREQVEIPARIARSARSWADEYEPVTVRYADDRHRPRASGSRPDGRELDEGARSAPTSTTSGRWSIAGSAPGIQLMQDGAKQYAIGRVPPMLRPARCSQFASSNRMAEIVEPHCGQRATQHLYRPRSRAGSSRLISHPLQGTAFLPDRPGGIHHELPAQ